MYEIAINFRDIATYVQHCQQNNKYPMGLTQSYCMKCIAL